jgi:hypothetical protein
MTDALALQDIRSPSVPFLYSLTACTNHQTACDRHSSGTGGLERLLDPRPCLRNRTKRL